MILQPNTETPISVGGRGKYLIVRSTSAPVFISADGLSPQRLESGDRINVLEFEKMFLSHHSHKTVNFDYQISDLEHKPASTSGLVVQRIIEPIQFEASVRVEDGLKVATIPSSQMVTHPDIEITPQTKTKLTSGGYRQVVMQVISDELTDLRVGDFNVSGNRGALVIGSKAAIGSLSFNFSGELYVYNVSSNTARLAVLEVK
ncbi:hypothetical protein [Vibrio gazogenes]|uniref:Uncharacterized protein n=1 Tax=Vibrio gazogenes TaxID=687 RepID=A0A1Z2SMF1_VIBGA|nr:hypothetical protein [Vibrio gazogenes]ASA54420.1 hypothetical protein BSQ33_00880 [Vibrio gazogenes]ASA58354.1 hypothetical protein BSQ33_21475 [Vibrio gazogenes]